MPRAVPALYLVILVLFVTAGSLLTSRTEPTDTIAAVPEMCTDVPRELVDELFPDADPTPSSTTRDGARYGQWLDEDGEILVELRCTRFRFSEFGPFRDALAAAEAGESTLLPTEPAAILAELPGGVTIRQLDEETGLYRTWFVRDALTPEEAEDVVERTHAAQADAAPDEA